jgi:hypothetical protein
LTRPGTGPYDQNQGEKAIPADKTDMKRIIAITVTLAVTSPYLAFAQVSSTVSLAEVARKEVERRKAAKKATRVISNANLGANEVDLPPTPPATGTPAKEPTISGGEPDEPVDQGAKKDQKYWQDRMAAAREDLRRTTMFAESLQTRINSLRTDFVNRDNPVERDKIQMDLNASLAELEKLKKEVDAKTKLIATIQDEARRAGAPAGWVR